MLGESVRVAKRRRRITYKSHLTLTVKRPVYVTATVIVSLTSSLYAGLTLAGTNHYCDSILTVMIDLSAIHYKLCGITVASKTVQGPSAWHGTHQGEYGWS